MPRAEYRRAGVIRSVSLREHKDRRIDGTIERSAILTFNQGSALRWAIGWASARTTRRADTSDDMAMRMGAHDRPSPCAASGSPRGVRWPSEGQRPVCRAARPLCFSQFIVRPNGPIGHLNFARNWHRAHERHLGRLRLAPLQCHGRKVRVWSIFRREPLEIRCGRCPKTWT